MRGTSVGNVSKAQGKGKEFKNCNTILVGSSPADLEAAGKHGPIYSIMLLSLEIGEKNGK